MIEVLIHVSSLWIYNNEVQAFTSVERRKIHAVHAKVIGSLAKAKKIQAYWRSYNLLQAWTTTTIHELWK